MLAVLCFGRRDDSIYPARPGCRTPPDAQNDCNSLARRKLRMRYPHFDDHRYDPLHGAPFRRLHALQETTRQAHRAYH